MPKVVVFSPFPAEAMRAQLADVADDLEVVALREVAPDGLPDAERLAAEVEACRGAHVAIADYTGDRRLRADHAAALRGTCRLVQVPSAGLDGIDGKACADAGLLVSSAGGLNAVAVAEWCVWAAIGALRGLSESATRVREGGFEQVGARYELQGKAVGLIGLGPIAQEAASRFEAFGCDVAYWSRRKRDAEEESRIGVRWLELEQLVAWSDVLVLAIALGPATDGLLSPDRIATMKPTAVVVNAGRAGLVDTPALVAALGEGRLHAVATDVYDTEPPPLDDPLLQAATVATPHVAGVTVESVGRILGRILDNTARALRGDDPIGVIHG